MACAWLRGTPSASARSAPSSSCPRLSSMISRSLGVRPASADQTTSRSSACSRPAPRSVVSSVTPAASSSGALPADRSRRRHSFRATAYSQGRRRSGSRSAASFPAAMMNVSWTASAASAGLGEQGLAIGIEARCVAVVGGFESRRVACHDGGHDLAVEHGITLELTGAGLGGFRPIAVTVLEPSGEGPPRGYGMNRAWPAPAHRARAAGRSSASGGAVPRAGPGPAAVCPGGTARRT